MPDRIFFVGLGHVLRQQLGELVGGNHCPFVILQDREQPGLGSPRRQIVLVPGQNFVNQPGRFRVPPLLDLNERRGIQCGRLPASGGEESFGLSVRRGAERSRRPPADIQQASHVSRGFVLLSRDRTG